MRLAILIVSVSLLYTTTVFGDPNNKRHMTNVEYSNDEIVNVEIRELLQLSLERRVSGDRETQITHSGLTVEVTPTATWKSKSNHFCRSFVVLTYAENIPVRSRKGIACRTHAGQWKTVEK